MKKTHILPFLAFAALFTGCATKEIEMIDRDNDKGDYVAGLDSRDFENAAADLIDDMISSGALERADGKRYVMAISRVKNDTQLHIQPSLIVKKIRTALLRSGKVVVTTAVSGTGAEDALVAGTRELAADPMFRQSTVAGEGQAISPDLSLSGAIIQQKNRIGKSKRERIDYYFQMSITDIRTGLALWEGETEINKKDAK